MLYGIVRLFPSSVYVYVCEGILIRLYVWQNWSNLGLFHADSERFLSGLINIKLKITLFWQGEGAGLCNCCGCWAFYLHPSLMAGSVYPVKSALQHLEASVTLTFTRLERIFSWTIIYEFCQYWCPSPLSIWTYSFIPTAHEATPRIIL